MWPLLLLFALAAAGTVSAQRHYVFTAPKAFLVGSEERMCLALFDTPETGDLTVGVFGETEAPPLSELKLAVSGVAGGSKQTCFNVDIPVTSRYMGRVDVSVVFPATANYSIKGSREVSFKKLDNEMTFVQTDKSLYKPGQLVQFRVLTVTGSLTPITLPLESVYIESPGRTRLAQWRNVSAPGGLVQLQLQLSEEPILGSWTITVKSASGKRSRKTFKVETYVLPKFAVEIKGPPFVVGDDKEVEWKICGVYTYGKPVSGLAVLNVTSGYRKTLVATKTARTGDDGGCARVRFSRADLGLGEYGRSRHSFSLTATFREDDTDITLSASREQQVHYQRLKLTAGDQGTKFFKPGIAYFDQIAVTNPDSSPAAAGVLVELCYKVQDKDGDEDDRSTWNVWSDLKGATCRNLTSDSEGLVKFGVPPQDPKVHGIRIRARTPEYLETKYPATEWGYTPIYMRTPQLNINMQGWFSESGSFLQLSKQIGKRFSCGVIADIPVYFTTKLNSKFRIHYQVISQGNIQTTDSVAVDFSEVSSRDLEVDEGHMIATAAVRRNETMPVGETTLKIPVTSALSTGFKVVAYLVVDGEVVADGGSYQAEPCLRNRVGLQWSQSTVRPNQELSLRLQAAPGSICGIDVVDKSVNLLSSENRITISSIFSILKKYNLGKYEGISQVQDHTYCREKYGEPNPEQESDPDTTSKSKRSTWSPHRPHSYWKSVFVDSLSAFDDASSLVLSDLALETRPCEALASPPPVAFADDSGFDGPLVDRMGVGPVAYSAMALDTDSPMSSEAGSHLQEHNRHSPLAPACLRRSSVAVMTDLLLETRTCSLQQRQLYPAMAFEAHNLGGGVPGPASAGSGAPVEEDVEPSAVPETVRTYFPETWLFDLHTVGEDGSVTVTQDAPDTITEWVAGAVCSSNTAGMGVAPAASFTTFQPFFVSYTLPYSVKRGEQLRLKVSVFNYEGHSLPMKLTLIDSEQFELQSAQVQTACVLPARPQVMTFLLRPSDLGQVNLTVVAEVYPEYPEQCGPQTVLAFQDAVTRPILVEPEGYLREITRSSFMCLSPENNELSGNTDDPDVTWPLTLPVDLVPDSERAEVTVVGDLLGPSIENLESLVRLPTGCGEQNMVKFAPNIHVMKYLTAVDELSESLKQKLSEYMKTGYQRELTYRHPDYSYSAFGSRDDSGSMWLTAFVLRSFSQAADFIYVDRDDLQRSVGWIEQQQQRLSGCFPSVGRVLHKDMKGGVASGNEATLTAYVTASLISSGVKLEEGTLKNAFRCLQNDGSSDLYTLVLRTYAYALSGHTKQARIDFNTLMTKAQKRGGLIWWENQGSAKNKALSVELGSYVILIAKLLRKDADVKDSESYFSSALGAVRWISEQRNSKGGFVSTQDTVLALEALAEFSADLPRSEQMDLKVFISEDGEDHQERPLKTVAVNRGNRLLAQKTTVPQLPTQLHITAGGVGCALVQATLRYNVITATPSDAMKIVISSKPKSGQKECLKHELDLCVSYLKEDSSNMAIVELAMVSGFIPNKSSLKLLQKNKKLGLKRWELINNLLVLYFDSLEAEPRCFGLTVQREEQVGDVKPAVVSVIDYYQPEFSISSSYSLDVECATEPILRPVPVPLPEIDGFVDQLDAAAAGNASSSTAATPLGSPAPPPSSSIPSVAGVTP